MFHLNLMNLVNYEQNVRLYCFFAVFILLALWEQWGPRRKESIPTVLRWPNNLGLGCFNHFFIRVFFSGAVLGVTQAAIRSRFGLFQWVEVPPGFSVCFTVIVVDWMIYYQHRLLHYVPLLWKIHRMHHADLEVDVTTGTRFHTLEILIMHFIKTLVVLLLGAPAAGILMYELILNASNLFNHSNTRLPALLEKSIRLVFVTPEMHRIHHSTLPVETNSDFGFIFSFWDRLFLTYRPHPQDGQEKMKLGLELFRDSKYLALWELFKIPFLDKNGHFAWNNLIKQK